MANSKLFLPFVIGQGMQTDFCVNSGKCPQNCRTNKFSEQKRDNQAEGRGLKKFRLIHRPDFLIYIPKNVYT